MFIIYSNFYDFLSLSVSWIISPSRKPATFSSLLRKGNVLSQAKLL